MLFVLYYYNNDTLWISLSNLKDLKSWVQGIEYNFVFKVDMINASNFVHNDLLMQELIFVVMIYVMLSMIVSHEIDIQDVPFM